MYFHFIDKKTYKILKREKKNIDRTMLTVGLVGPIAGLPQIISIYSTQDAGSVSQYSWAFYTISSFISLLYGIVHGLKPVIISNSFSFITCSAVTIGCLLY